MNTSNIATLQLKRRASKVCLFSLLVVASALLSFADAQYATGGAGRFKNEIIWFSWGAAGAAVSNTTKTNSYTVGGQTLAVTCSLSNVAGTITAYRPGSWGGDGFDDMYNIGGTGGNNQLVVGLNTAQGGQPSFTFSCSATLGGASYPLDGLVMADAEQSGSSAEYVEATISSTGTWRIIDRYRTAGCANSTSALQTNTATTRTLRLSGTAECTSGPTAVAFMEDVTTANATMKGTGISAIALGVIVDGYDRGDAPASYGDAAHLLSTNYSGGTLTPGTATAVNNDAFTLATLGTPTVRLGSFVDGEPTEQNSAAADADDLNNLDDEDALAATQPGTVVPNVGGSYTLSNVACNGSGVVRGWIDWNIDGDFLDTGETSSNAPTCTGTSVSLSWSVPAIAKSGSSFLRLRTATLGSQVALPSGTAATGDAEDYPLTLAPAVTGTVFGDTNRNGVRETGENAFTAATATVTLTSTATSQTFTATTATGGYSFSNLPVGTYNVTVSTPGYVVTTPARTVTVAAGTTAVVADIGVAQTVTSTACSVTYAGGLASPFSIYPVNTTTGAPGTKLFDAPYATVAFARDPVTNRLYFLENTTATTVRVGYYSFVTGQTVAAGTITKNTADTGNFTRFGFNQSGVGYASISANNAVYKLTPSGNTLTAERLGTTTGDLGVGLSGDFAITQANRAWLSANGVIYRINLNLPTLESIKIFDTGIDDATNRVNGVAFDPNIDGNLLVASPSNLYTTSLGTFSVSAARPMTGQPSTSGDLANCIIPALEPTLTIIKSVSPVGPVSPGTELTYTITVTNTGNAVAVKTTFQDSIPANTTYVAGSTTKNGAAEPDAAGGVMPFVTASTITSPNAQFGPGIVGTGTANQATVSFKVRVNNPFPSTATSVTNRGFVEYDSGTGDTRVTQPTTPPGGGTGGTSVAVGSRDFGDAPDGATGTATGNYQTTGSDNGPSHTIVSGLKLGPVAPDADDGTLQNVAATADNTTGTDDEDGVTSFPTISTAAAQVITVPVTVTNTTSAAASLVGYIDFNKNGDFSDSGERSAIVPVSVGQTSASVVFTTPSGLTAGTTYARFRLGGVAGEVTSPFGAASSGEVEDYRVTIGSPDLTLSKTHTGSFTRGGTGTYTLTVRNAGDQPTSGTTITVTDTLPAGLSVNGGSAGTVASGNPAWTCSSNAATPQVITCTSTAVIATSGSSVFTLNVNVAANAGATSGNSVTNSASVSGGGEAAANSGNNGATDSTATVAPTDLTLAKTHSGDFTVGSVGTYSFTVTNIGGVASSGTITVTDTLPTGLTFVNGSATGAGWSCSVSGQTATCTSNTAIPAGGGSTFSFNVNVGVATAPGTNSVTNTATVSGGGDSNPANNSANNGSGDPTTILSSDLTVSKTHTPSSFVRGGSGSYSVTVTNSGTAATSGTITVTDTLPAGLSFVTGSVNGAGWGCSASGQVITCTSTTSLATTQSSTFSFSVNVASTAATSVTNKVTVAGGNEATAKATNNTYNDPTPTVDAGRLTLVKSVRNVTTTSGFGSAGSGKPGDVLEYCVAYSNPGQSPVTNTVVSDTIPTTTTPLTSVADYGSRAIRWRVTAPSADTQNLTAPADTDAGELGAALTVRVGAVPAGGAGDVCFQAQIK